MDIHLKFARRRTEKSPVGGPTQGMSMILAALCLAFLVLPCKLSAESDVRQSMVKIYAVQNEPDYDNPWNMRGPEASSGSGCVIEGNRILTNAHVVSNRTFIQVRLHGKSEKHTARVIAVSHEADLALLTVEKSAFFEGVQPLSFSDLPQVQQEVVVYGFPEGGDTLSTTKGVISRVEHQQYVHSFMKLLAGQLDAAVNPGNSGGPVMKGDRIVGVVMQSLSESQNIGYMVPVPVIRHFLEDIADGRYDGFPEDGIVCQDMENRALRKMYGLRHDQSGALVISVLPGTPADGKVFPGDVILSLDGYRVADDGTVEFRPGERTHMSFCTQQHQVGEELSLRILRKGGEKDVRVPLNIAWGRHRLIPMVLYDTMPTYYIYGGLVFSPLTINYLLTWGDSAEEKAPSNLVRFLGDSVPTVRGEEVVVLIKVLSSDINTSYDSFVNTRITEVNGRRIKNLRDLISAVEGGDDDPFVVFKNEKEIRIVMERKMVKREQGRILKTYRIPSDHSKDLQ